MAKTPWTAGTATRLTNALMRAYWGTSATTGHTHNGTDVDGDCPKIFGTPTTIEMEIVGATGITFNLSYIKSGRFITCHVPYISGAPGATGFSAQPVGATALPSELKPLTGEAMTTAMSFPCMMESDASSDLQSGFAFFDFQSPQDTLNVWNAHIPGGAWGVTSNGWYPFSMNYISKT